MDDGISIDTTELDRAVVRLGDVPRETLTYVRKAVQVTAGHVKEAWRGRLEGTRSAPRVPYSITYDTTELRNGIKAEVGATKGTGNQGGVALLLEYGAPRSRSHLAARGFGLRSLQDNLPDLEQGIKKAIDDGVSAAGL